MKNVIFSILAIAMFASCEKEAFKLDGEEYLIFGVYNGYCVEECTSLFKITNTELFADDMTTFHPDDDLKFSTDPLPSAKYDLAYTAFDQLPDQLTDTMDKSFGCPGCVDQDIIFLQYFDGADKYEWMVDTDVDALPEYLQDYAKKVVEIVDDIKK